MFKKVKLLLLIVLVYYSTVTSAQDSVRIYFDINNEQVSGTGVYYFRDLVKQNDTSKLYVGSEYYVNGVIKSIGYYTKNNGQYLKTGKFIEYRNKTKSGEGLYYYDSLQNISFKTGKWKYYYLSGLLKEERLYQREEQQGLVINSWSIKGKPEVEKGSGSYCIYRANYPGMAERGMVKNGKPDGLWELRNEEYIKLSETMYSQGVWLWCKEYNPDGKLRLKYDTLNAPARYRDDFDEMVAELELDYPEEELTNDIQGVIYVGMVTEADGTFHSLKIVGGVRSEGLEKAALKYVSQFPKFIPAKKDGVSVRGQHTIPVVFKIT